MPAILSANAMNNPALPGYLVIFRRLLRGWGRVELAVAAAAFVAVVLINVAQITMRYGFSGSIFWVQEFSLLLMLVAYFIGASCVFRSRHYVIVQFFVERVKPAWQRRAYWLAQALTVVFCSVIVIEALAEAPRQMRTYSVILHFPRFFNFLPLIVASLSIILTSLYFALAVHSLGSRHPDRPVADIESDVRIG